MSWKSDMRAHTLKMKWDQEAHFGGVPKPHPPPPQPDPPPPGPAPDPPPRPTQNPIR